jgi:peptide/nickel transport system permease protein
MRKKRQTYIPNQIGLWFVLLFSAALFTVPFFLPFDPLRTDMANRLQPIQACSTGSGQTIWAEIYFPE